jgi:hypothetical protein
MKAKRFENWFEFTLLKNIKKGMTVIMDNARFHCKQNLIAIAEKQTLNSCFYSRIHQILIP